MILEGIVTTRNEGRSTNISPMGPSCNELMTSLTLRPFKTSNTYKNLKRTREGILHVTDDAELLAHSAVGEATGQQVLRCDIVDVEILASACRWYAFRVRQFDDSDDRTRIECDVVGMGRLRDFFGWNRAKHAVLEAAILATRVHLLPSEHIRAQFDHLGLIVTKTGGAAEMRAFQFLSDHLDRDIDVAP